MSCEIGELKPCPFCGGEALFWTKKCRYGYIAWIQCETCGNQTNAVSAKNQADEDDFYRSAAAKKLEAKWNRRIEKTEGAK